MAKERSREQRLKCNFSCEPTGASKPVLTEGNVKGVKERQKLRASFLEQDRQQKDTYVRDLEETLRLNKELIAELVQSGQNEAATKTLFDKLNHENATLQNQLRRTINERDECQANYFITAQILEELKQKEEETAKESEEKRKELLEQLSRKEYVVQMYGRKMKQLEGVLLKFAHKEQEIARVLKSLNLDTEESQQSISNIIDSNKEQSNEIERLRKRIIELENKLCKLRATNLSQAAWIAEHSPDHSGSPSVASNKRPGAPHIPTLDLSKLPKAKKPPLSDAAYIHKLEESIKHLSATNADLEAANRSLQERNSTLEKETENLFKINEKLSQALQYANRKIDTLQKRSRGGHNTTMCNTAQFKFNSDDFDGQSLNSSNPGQKRRRNRNYMLHDGSPIARRFNKTQLIPHLSLATKTDATKDTAAEQPVDKKDEDSPSKELPLLSDLERPTEARPTLDGAIGRQEGFGEMSSIEEDVSASPTTTKDVRLAACAFIQPSSQVDGSMPQ